MKSGGGVNDLDVTRQHALRLIKFRPRAENELRQRLLRKRFAPSTIDLLLAEFKRKDLINDAKFAKLFANQQMSVKPMGRRALLSRLKAKGVSFDLAARATEEATAERPEGEVARELALSRVSSLKGLDRQTAQRRLFGFLSRRGFSSDVVVKVVKEITRSSSEDLDLG